MIGQHYYTWCPKDIGCEGITGYQTRAKSHLISADIERIVKRYCSQYKLPRSLSHLGTKSEDLTTDELQKSPVAIHYYPISKDFYGLTRVCLSSKQSGRGGNFFSHTFVLPHNALSQIDFNPFVLIRSGLFKNSAEDTSTALDDLSDLPSSINIKEYSSKWLDRCRSVDEKLLCTILTCISVSEQTMRPIIVSSLSTGQDSTDLIEAVFSLLPQQYLSTISFSTYEPDPYRLLTRAEDVEYHTRKIIGTISAEDGGQFQFREDEYQAGFYMFDLNQGRQSDTPSPSKYSQYICDAVNRSDAQTVEELKGVINSLEIGFNPEMWNRVIPVTYLLSSDLEMSPEKWRPAIGALQDTCKTPGQAKAGLELLWKKSHNYLAKLSTDTAKEVLSTCKELLHNVGNPDIFRRQATTEITKSFYNLLLASRYSIASDLLRLSGNHGDILRRKVILQGMVVSHQKNKWPETAVPKYDNKSEIMAFIDILAEGFCEISKDRSSVQFLPNILTSGLSTAQSSGCFKEAWNRVVKWLLADGLKSIAEKHIDNTLETLGTLLSREGEYDGYRQLLLWQLKNAMPSQEKKAVFFSKIEEVCRKSPDPVIASDEVMKKAGSYLGKENLIPLYVVLFANGGEEVSEKVKEHYKLALKDKAVTESGWNFRRHMASLGGAKLLAWEYLEMLFPWSDESGKNIRLWIDKVFRISPEAAFAAISAFCNEARQQKDSSICFSSLNTCLKELRKANLGDTGRRLISTVAETLILSSPSHFNEKYLEEIVQEADTESWGKETKALIQVEKIIKTAKRLPESDKPDLELLLKENPDLPHSLTLLEDSAWTRNCERILDGFYGLYLEDHETVSSAVKLILAPIQKAIKLQSNVAERSSEAVALFVKKLRSELLDGTFKKDTVTRVRSLAQLTLVAAFLVLRSNITDHYSFRMKSQTVEQHSIDQLIARIIAAILAEDSRLTRQLLWPYLETHPALKKNAWSSWLDGFKSYVDTYKPQGSREVDRVSSLFRFGKSLFVRKGKDEESYTTTSDTKGKVKKRK